MSVKTIQKNNFKTEVLNSDRTVLLDFWAPWCGPCRMLAPTLESVAAKRPDITVGKINVDEESELAAAFGIVSIPTLIVVKNGTVVNRATGALPETSVLNLL